MKAPTAKRTALKAKGPMLRMPLRCAENAVPHMAAVRRRRPSAFERGLRDFHGPEPIRREACGTSPARLLLPIMAIEALRGLCLR